VWAGYEGTMETKNVGLAGLRGWRGSVANAVAAPVAKRSSFGEDQIRAVIGAVFLLLSLMYVAGALKDMLRDND
jgi:hypothetical protein